LNFILNLPPRRTTVVAVWLWHLRRSQSGNRCKASPVLRMGEISTPAWCVDFQGAADDVPAPWGEDPIGIVQPAGILTAGKQPRSINKNKV
jgi:hypothetical protein